MQKVMIDLSIIVVNYNTKELTKKCLESVKKNTQGLIYEIIVIDNGSQEDFMSWLEKFQIPDVHITIIKNSKNLGFAQANNQGIKKSKGKYVLLLNSDTEINENTFTKMVDFMEENDDVGISTCALFNPDGTIQATGGFSPTLGRIFLWALFLDDLPLIPDIFGSYHPHSASFYVKSKFYENAHEQDWVTGAFLLMRRVVFEKTGYLDEDFFMYGEEVDFCIRAKKAGFKIWYTPITHIIHIGQASSDNKKIRFLENTGRERSIIGEFEGLKKIYKKHFPLWQFLLLRILIKLASLVRLIIFGLIMGQKEARRVYAKSFFQI